MATCKDTPGTTHHAGCACWEERRDAELAAAKAKVIEATTAHAQLVEATRVYAQQVAATVDGLRSQVAAAEGALGSAQSAIEALEQERDALDAQRDERAALLNQALLQRDEWRHEAETQRAKTESNLRLLGEVKRAREAEAHAKQKLEKSLLGLLKKREQWHELEAQRDAAIGQLNRIRRSVVDCAYCGGVGQLVRLPGDVVEACPACGGLRAALAETGLSAESAPSPDVQALLEPLRSLLMDVNRRHAGARDEDVVSVTATIKAPMSALRTALAVIGPPAGAEGNPS